MPERITTIDFPGGALFGRVAGNIVIVVAFATTAIGLTQVDALVPRPGAAPECTDPPGSGLIDRSEVVGLWVPETLVDPSGRELPAQAARNHQELKKVLERRGQENLWYAITVRAHLASHQVEDSSFIRYPYRQPEYLAELKDVLTAVAGRPRRHASADYSAAIVHIMPAEMSQREWLEAMQASSLPRPAVPHELEARQ